MREITTHHDGHGLTELLKVEARDEPGPGGAHHLYRVTHPDVPSVVGYVQYQMGPRNSHGGMPGLLDPCLLAIVRDRLESFQAGPFACEENARALEHVVAAMQAMKDRADNRAKRGVLGHNKK